MVKRIIMGRKSKLKQQRREEKMAIVQQGRMIETLRKTERLYDRLKRFFISQFPQSGVTLEWQSDPPIIVMPDDLLESFEHYQNKVNKDDWQIMQSINVSMRLPFNNVFIECDVSRNYFVFTEDRNHYYHPETKAGVYIRFFEFDSISDSEIENLPLDIDEMRFSSRKAAAFLEVSCFIEDVAKGTFSDQVVVGITLDNEGKYLGTFGDDSDGLTDEDFDLSNIWVILYGLTLLNCQNVELIDNEPPPDIQRQYQEHFGVPLTKYKTLALRPMGKQSRSDKPQERFDVMPLHLRRGNFATYTEDAPLLGKYTGTFWRPATAVGNKKNGIVVKDYEVKADSLDTEG
jgi:hypothetical protein